MISGRRLPDTVTATPVPAKTLKNCLLVIDLNHFELIDFFGFSVQHVHGTTQSRIKGADDPNDIEWIFDVSNGRPNESLFKGP